MTRPICWKTRQITFFAADPTFGPLGYLFEDLLLDFFDVKQTAASHLFLRIEDYHCRQNHAEFKRMVDFLYARGHPFVVAVVPAWRDPETGTSEDLESRPDFVAALRYAQQRGGRLILHGYAHETQAPSRESHEFWDGASDRPLGGNETEYTRRRVGAGVRQMLKQGLFPLAWETPHYAASSEVYAEVARTFSTSVERVQLSDATCLAAFDGAALTTDRFGRLIVPENLGYVLDGPTNFLAAIRGRGEIITRLRGTVAGCVLHSYHRLEKLAALAEELEGLNTAFLDLADLDHSIVLPEVVLLTGNASATIELSNVTVRWRAYDRAGNLLAERQEEAASSGRRTFRRTGTGDYELFEFPASTP